MSDFYITLPSHSSKTEYPNNRANSFKIRLPYPIRLEDGGWKVGLVSVSLPDPTSQLPPLMKDPGFDLFKTSWIALDTLQGVTPTRKVFHAVFEPQDLRQQDLQTLTGVGFMRTVHSFFDKKKVEKVLRGGWRIADNDGKNHTAVQFEWEGEDLLLKNTDVKLQKHLGTYYPLFAVDAEFAVEMGWFKDLGNDQYAIGPNLTIEILNGITPLPIDTALAHTSGDEFWRYETSSKFILMTLTCNWRFSNLNTSFKNILDSTKRSLFIYSDVGGSGVVGNQVTDLLREVNYQREGKGYQYFEPTHIQYIPVRKDVIEIIETQVSETTGDLVQFGEGNTIVTLHFKKT